MKRNLTELKADLAIHQKLDDEPNDVGGLTAQELKETFDRAGLVIQDYLNNTHLPEVTDALEEAVEEAKGYADKKVVAIGAGDMAAGVYDVQGRRTDVYAYAEERAREAIGDAARFGSVAGGSSKSRVWDNSSLFASFHDYIDPKGIWDPEGQRFIVPQGASAMLITAELKWGRQPFGMGYVDALVNGVKVAGVSGPVNSTGSYIYETVILPVPVKGGDEVRVQLRSSAGAGDHAEVNISYMRAEIIL